MDNPFKNFLSFTTLDSFDRTGFFAILYNKLVYRFNHNGGISTIIDKEKN